MIDYPIKFFPIPKERIWGGEKLSRLLHKPFKGENVGESWEISGVKGAVSKVANGPLKGKSLLDLLNDYKEKLVGDRVYADFGSEFPLLIKFIDAKTTLSVQLHPNDEISRKKHDSFGKTEMWYIMQADKGAEINIGFYKDLLKEEYLQALNEQKIKDLLHYEKVKKGDCFFINTGKVHAIGAGVLLAEIQQSSDITYRIFDWNRLDAEGNARELHTDLALDSIDFQKKNDFKLDYRKTANKSSEVAKCPFFTTNYLPVKGKILKDYEQLDSFVIYMCVNGKAEIGIGEHKEEIRKGETVFIPARTKKVYISSNECEFLEIYI